MVAMGSLELAQTHNRYLVSPFPCAWIFGSSLLQLRFYFLRPGCLTRRALGRRGHVDPSLSRDS